MQSNRTRFTRLIAAAAMAAIGVVIIMTGDSTLLLVAGFGITAAASWATFTVTFTWLMHIGQARPAS
ncbi:hypothetical protein D477_014231 [Arthrobacter crystallopoietes BAB-32]|uniref:Uncharacterized protein n=1 Tax=Arthrobacter crystallopoietes BAB-32 TaxID=1246476 RepID=N1UT24_9MICC|nr:hypothetical protein [Arthrobacter crystallopoietes]EMY33566.1 hypothetical protein D477_014231 [Arthrobacter crystallopoietes BAB-32]